MWFTVNKGTTVWAETAHGKTIIARCDSKTVPVANQRKNARLCAAAPLLLDLLIDAKLEPDQLQRLQELLAFINGSNAAVE